MLDVIKLHSGDTEIILESKLTFFVKFEFTFFHICAVDKYGQLWTLLSTFITRTILNVIKLHSGDTEIVLEKKLAFFVNF